MHIDNHSNFAVYGENVTGFTLDTCLIDGTNGTNNATPINDGSVTFFGLLGTSSFTSSTIKGGFQRNVDITNSSGNADITISGCTIRDTNNGAVGTPITGNIQGGAININHGAGNGIWQGKVSGNWIGDPAIANSGSA